MLNVVTGDIGYPAAVLIRSVEVITGPGRLTRALGITGALNRRQASERAGLWFVDRGKAFPPDQILKTPRIGIAYAGLQWAAKKYRFVVGESRWKLADRALPSQP